MPEQPLGFESIYLGTVSATDAPYQLPMDALTRGVYVRGAIGSGKTSLLRRLLMGRGLHQPFLNYDFIGTGHRELETWIASAATTLAVAESHTPEFAGATLAFLRRFGFLTIGTSNPAVRIDLLRRRMLPNGRRESLRAVTSRVVECLLVKINNADISIRVRFVRIATALIAVLAAAERPISEGLTLLDDAANIDFLDREIDRRSFSRSDLLFLQQQRRELAHVLALRPTDPRKSWRAFEEETSSTRNSLADFAPGSVLGDLFSDETFPLEAVVFGNACLSITNREPQELLKTKAYQLISAVVHGLALHRQDMPAAPPLVAVIDEPRWLGLNLPGILALSRNLGVSYWLAAQNDYIYEDLGLRTLGKQLRSLTNLQINFRPTTFEEAEEDVVHSLPIAPDGLVQRFWASGTSESDTSNTTISRSWSNACRYAEDGTYEGMSGGDSDGDAFASGSSSGSSEHEVLNVVGWEQTKYAAQRRLWMPRFTGTVREEGHGTEVAFAPALAYPATLSGVPILQLFRQAHNATWRAGVVPRTPYDPTVRMVSTPTERDTPPPPPAVASPQARTTGSVPQPAAEDRPQTPAAPPTFTPPGTRGRRRKPRRGGGEHA